MPGTKTTVEVSHDTWKRLNTRKEPGEAFDQVIERLLDKEDC